MNYTMMPVLRHHTDMMYVDLGTISCPVPAPTTRIRDMTVTNRLAWLSYCDIVFVRVGSLHLKISPCSLNNDKPMTEYIACGRQHRCSVCSSWEETLLCAQ